MNGRIRLKVSDAKQERRPGIICATDSGAHSWQEQKQWRLAMPKAKKKKKSKVLTGMAAKQAVMRAICRAIERDK